MSQDIFETEVNVDPTGDMIVNFLIDKDKEEPYVDFKETISISKDAPFAKITKDIFAFSNYGGGFILLGFKDSKNMKPAQEDDNKRNFEPVGLPNDFHMDQADLQVKFNAYSNHPIELRYREFFRVVEGQQRRLGVIYVPPSTTVLTPIKDGTYKDMKGKEKTAFIKDEILFRRGTQSVTATTEEVAWINRRALKQDYRMSVLSGQADEVVEILYSNLLEVKKLPDKVWIAEERHSYYDHIPPQESKYIAYKRWNHGIVSFEDLSNQRGPLAFKVHTSSAKPSKVKDWLADADKRRLIMELLNKEVLMLARRLGMHHSSGDTGETDRRSSRRKTKIFYPCQGNERKESWISRAGTSSTRTVAKRTYADQLHRNIFVHAAITPRFTEIDGQLYLQISQSMILTEDGRKATYGAAEGTVITRKTYNKYNASYLNSLLFWIYKLADGSESISLASGKIEISAKPIEVKMDVGILSDRPAREIIGDFDTGMMEKEYAKI